MVDWEPQDIIREEIGHIQVVFDGQDVTFFRGTTDHPIPTIVETFANEEPFGDTSAVIQFPQVTPFDHIDNSATGGGELDFLRDWSNVELYLVDPDGTKQTLFEGMLASLDDADGEDGPTLTCQCIGALYQVDLYVRAPRFFQDPIPVRHHFASQFSHVSRPHLRTATFYVDGSLSEVDQFTTRRTGSWGKTLTDYIQEELASMVQWEGGNESQVSQWTIHQDRPRTPVLRKKDRTSLHWTVSVGTPGITHELTRDLTQSSNVLYGEGTDQAGTTWRNSRPGHLGTYDPLAASELVHPVEDNVEFWLNAVRLETHQAYGSGVSLAEARDSAKRQLSRDRHPGWSGTMSLKTDPREGSRYLIRSGENVFLRSFRSDGSQPTVATEELTDPDGNSFSPALWVNRETGMVFETDPNDNAKRHRGFLFHISGMEASPSQGEVTLTIDTRARDMISLAEQLARQRESSTDATKRLQVNRASSVIDDETVPWDYNAGSGYIPQGSVNMVGETTDVGNRPSDDNDYYIFVNGTASKWEDRWTVVKILAATKVSIEKTELYAYNADGTRAQVPFSLGFFSEQEFAGDMVMDPWSEDGWHTGDGDEALNQVPPSVIVAWGQFEQRAGFYPGAEFDGDPVTGEFVDGNSWEFELEERYAGQLHLGIYAEEDVYFQGRLFRGVGEGT